MLLAQQNIKKNTFQELTLRYSDFNLIDRKLFTFSTRFLRVLLTFSFSKFSFMSTVYFYMRREAT